MKKSLLFLSFILVFLAVFFSCAKENPTQVNIAITVVVPSGTTPAGTSTITPTHTMTGTATATRTATATFTSTAAVPGVTYTGPFDDTLYSLYPNAEGISHVNYTESFIPLSDGWVIYGDRIINKLMVYNVITGQIHTQIQLTASPNKLVYDRTNSIVYAGLSNATSLAKVNMNTYSVSYIPVISPIKYMCIGPNSRIYATHERVTSSPNDVFSIIDGPAGSVLRIHYGNYFEGPVEFNAPSNQVLIYKSNIYRYSLAPSTLNLTQIESVGYVYITGNTFQMSPDYLHITARDQISYTLTDFNPVNLGVKYGAFQSGSDADSLGFSPDSGHLALWDGNSLYAYNTGFHSQEMCVTPPYSFSSLREGRQTSYSMGGKLIITLLTQGTNPSYGSNFYWKFFQP